MMVDPSTITFVVGETDPQTDEDSKWSTLCWTIDIGVTEIFMGKVHPVKRGSPRKDCQP